MGNLGQREKYGIFVVLILLVMLAIYFFGIRANQNKASELEARKLELDNQISYYDSLKQENDNTRSQIREIESTIADLESGFIPVIRTENLERYIMNVFSEHGCLYLNSISSENVVPERVVLPNGSLADDALLVTKVTVQYATTDGLLPSAYNMTGEGHIDILSPDADIEAQLEAINIMPWARSYDWRALEADYDNFVESLREIEGENQDCVKITDVTVTGEGGYLLMSATVSFYSANFTDRVSEPVFADPYVVWSGANLNSIGTDGYIGQRLLVPVNCGTNTDWCGTVMVGQDVVGTERPFASYYAVDAFEYFVQNYGVLSTIIGGDELGDGITNPGEDTAAPDVTEEEPAA